MCKRPPYCLSPLLEPLNSLKQGRNEKGIIAVVISNFLFFCRLYSNKIIVSPTIPNFLQSHLHPHLHPQNLIFFLTPPPLQTKDQKIQLSPYADVDGRWTGPGPMQKRSGNVDAGNGIFLFFVLYRNHM